MRHIINKKINSKTTFKGPHLPGDQRGIDMTDVHHKRTGKYEIVVYLRILPEK